MARPTIEATLPRRVEDEFIPMEHPIEADEEPPPLEPVDEEAESFEEGLVGAPQ